MSRFELRRILGVGGMGTVYEAYDRPRDRVVAVKTLQSFDAFQLYCLKNEFRALADIVHPNLVSLHELVHEEQAWWLVMERVQGSAVDVWARAERDPGDPALQSGTSASRVRRAFAQISEGLSALHRAGKLHRDLKPSNVLVEASGRAILLDFGLVVASDSNEPTFMRKVGTAEYLAPERLRGEPASAASDMYALGVMLYELLTGLLPRNPRKLAAHPVRPPLEIDPNVPADLSELCCELLSDTPGARPSADDVTQRMHGQSTPRTRSRSDDELFLGRTQELSWLQEGLASCEAGGLALRLVEGESGIGKSALLDAFVRSVRQRRSAQVVLSRCLLAESSSYKGVDGLIDGLSVLLLEHAERAGAVPLPAGIEALGTMFPVLRRLEPIDQRVQGKPTPSEPVRVRRRRAIDALAGLCAHLTKDAPLLLCIDDVQWSDLDAAQLLADLCATDGSSAPALSRVCILLLGHEGAADGAMPFARLAQHPSMARLTLQRLPRQEVAQLARATMGASVPGELVERVAQLADGHPIAVRELSLYLAQRGGGEEGAAADLDELVRARVAALSVQERQLLHVVALLGGPAALEVLEEVSDAGRSSDLVTRSLSAQRFLRVRGRSRRFELFHDRLRGPIASSIDAPTKLALHARIAHALAASSALPPDQLSYHLEQAGQPSEAAWCALRAGREALASLAFDRAAAALQRVLALHPGLSREERRAVLLDLAVSYEGRGSPQEAAETWLRAVDLTDARSEALLLESRAAEQWLVGGHVERGLNVLRRIAGEAGMRIPESRLSATLELLFYRVRAALRGRRAQRLDASQAALLKLKTDATFTISRALGLLDMDLGVAVHARSLLYALRSGDPLRMALGLAWDASFRGALSGDRDRGFLLSMQRAEQLAGELKDEQATAWCALARGTTIVLSGKYHDGLRQLDQAHALFAKQPRGVAWELTMTRVVRAAALAWSGQLKALIHDVSSWLREAEDRGDAYAGMVLRMRASNGIRRLALNEPEQLLLEVDDQLARWPRHPMVENLSLRYGHFLRTFANLARGDAATADAHLTRLRRDPARLFVYMPRALRAEHELLTGLTALAVSQPRLSEARKLARTLVRDPRGYGKALGNTLYAALALREESTGGPAAVQGALLRAREAAEQAGMRGLSGSASLLLASRAGEPAALESAQRQLAAEGVVHPDRFASFWFTPWLL